MWKTNWDHKIKIKHLWMDRDTDPTPIEILDMCRKIIEILRRLQARLGKDSDLYHDLDNVIEEFELIMDDDVTAEAFDFALQMLYDQADYQKRIWVG